MSDYYRYIRQAQESRANRDANRAESNAAYAAATQGLKEDLQQDAQRQDAVNQEIDAAVGAPPVAPPEQSPVQHYARGIVPLKQRNEALMAALQPAKVDNVEQLAAAEPGTLAPGEAEDLRRRNQVKLANE